MSNSRARGFSLIETMIAAALLGLIGAAVATVLSFAARESGQSRLRTIASAHGRETLERVAHTVRLAEYHKLADSDLCDLLESAGGAMDASAPAAVAGACPDRTVSNVAVPGTQLKEQVTIAQIVAAGVPRMYGVTVTITGTGLSKPVTATTQVVRDTP